MIDEDEDSFRERIAGKAERTERQNELKELFKTVVSDDEAVFAGLSLELSNLSNASRKESLRLQNRSLAFRMWTNDVCRYDGDDLSDEALQDYVVFNDATIFKSVIDHRTLVRISETSSGRSMTFVRQKGGSWKLRSSSQLPLGGRKLARHASRAGHRSPRER